METVHSKPDLEPAVTSDAAVSRLAALAHPTRLALFRRLVEAGPEGLAAGVLAALHRLPPATLSFHVKELAQAGLVVARPRGRYVIYSPDFQAINGLIAYLTENCCSGAACVVDDASCASRCGSAPLPTRRPR
jgi:DNA-binding transcriptional ArsR family regulator